MREKDIKHEAGRFWVGYNGHGYACLVAGLTHSITDSVYEASEDGLSLAVARCDYLAKRTSDGWVHPHLRGLPTEVST